MGPRTTKAAGGGRPAGANGAARKDVGRWLLGMAAMLAAILAAYFVQQRQSPCGDPFDPPPQVSQADWWLCPHEANRHNRDIARLESVTLRSVHFNGDGQRGWVVGDAGTILTTRDGGQSWQSQTGKVRSRLWSVAASADGQRGWVVGEAGTILATRDGGQSWQPQASKVRSDLLAVTASADGQRGWAVGSDGTILATRDGGQGWQPQDSGVRSDLLAVAVSVDGQRGWAVGWKGAILATRNGGQAWQPQAGGVQGVLWGVAASAGGQRGWVVGSDGTVLTTSDGGQNWQPQASGVRSDLWSVAASVDGQRGWAVGLEGTILATSDGGQSWQPQASGVRRLLWGVAASADGRRGWAVGEAGTILATPDGGQSWQPASVYSRDIAPWYGAFVTVLLLCAPMLVRRGFLRRAQAQEDRITGHAVGDVPLSRADEDRLNFAPIAEAVSAFLRHEKTLPSLTLAVTAAWGQGKSSLMGLMRQRLRAAGAPTVWFNAWHHQKEPVLLAALLGAVVKQGIPPWLTPFGLWFRCRLVWTRLSRRPLLGLLPMLVFVTLCLGAVVFAVAAAVMKTEASANGAEPSKPNPAFAYLADTVHGSAAEVLDNTAVESLLAGEWSAFAHASISAFTREPSKVMPLLLAAALAACLFLLVTHFCRPFPANPGALLASVGPKFSLSQAEDQTTLRQRFRDHFHDVTWAFRPRTLTVFIDDLDRCEPAKSAEMLEAVNYLTDSGLCFVVLGIDKEIVEAQLGEAYGPLAEQAAKFEQARKAAVVEAAAAPVPPPEAAAAADHEQVRLDYARKYLKKLIQIEVPVPAFGTAQLQALLEARTPEERDRLLQFASFCDWLHRMRGGCGQGLRIVAVVATTVWMLHQGWLWAGQQDEVQQKKTRANELVVSGAESALSREARQYVSYLKREVADLRAQHPADLPASRRAASAASASAPAAGDLRLAARESQLRLAERWLDQAEKSVDRMEEHHRAKQDALLAEVGRHHALLQARLVELISKDEDYQRKAAASRAAAVSAGGATPSSEADRPGPPQANATAAATAAVPLVLAVPVVLLAVIAGAGVFVGRDRYKIGERRPYREALERWQPVLLEREAMRAPREAKRFLNLSRYLTLRTNAVQYLPWVWWKRWLARLRNVTPPGAGRGVDESAVVGLTVLLLTRPKRVPADRIGAFLLDPKAFMLPHEKDEKAADSEDARYMRRVAELLGNDGDIAWGPGDVAEFLRAAGEFRSSGEDRGARRQAAPAPPA